MKTHDFLQQEQEIVNSYLKLKHGYELLWFGSSLVSGSIVSPIQRHLNIGFLNGDAARQAGGHLYPNLYIDRERFPLEAHSIDLIVFSHVFEFEPSPEILLREIYRVLRPDGMLIITGLNPVRFFSARKLLKILRPDCFFKSQKIYLRSASDFLKIIRKHSKKIDFKLKKYEPFGFCSSLRWEKYLRFWFPQFSRGYTVVLEKQTLKLREIVDVQVQQEIRSMILQPVFGREVAEEPQSCSLSSVGAPSEITSGSKE
jgi:SAM-dependent methyltransferase